MFVHFFCVVYFATDLIL
ncbi:unnamed protein product [Acanthoscelides obtectus]|uniref:Uncharacterized protein n=1 Tax=Acanthoscelides obtectus TaxID=200917 RepID=A0A9P0JRV1_ACAOB|nr:unnamed protein product [Acanthoscelides obtectus]CAK1668041.1 hypothetical protein AOBTE_LOCUS26193 [Acanthoscelides obtectus]